MSGAPKAAESTDPPLDLVARSTTGAATTAVVGLLGRGAGLLTTVLVTHFLSKAEYGHANLALIISSVTNLATLMSPQQALLTRHAQYDLAARLVHFWAVWSGALVSILLFWSGRPVLAALGQPEAAPLLQVYCLALFFERLGVIPALELRYRLRFADVAKLDLLGDASYVGVTVAAALLGAGAVCLPLGMVARHGARLLLLAAWVGRRVLPLPPAGFGPTERELISQLVRYTLPIHLGAFGELATLYLDNIFVGTLYGAAAQGLYAVGYTLVMTPTDTIARYGANALVRALGVKDGAARQRVFLLGLRYLSLLLFPIGVGAALLAPTLEVAILPQHWHGVAPLVVGLSAGAVTLGCFQLAFAQLTALHRPTLGGLLPATRVLLFGLGLYLVARWDVQRQHLSMVAWAVSFAFLLAVLIAMGLSARADRLRPTQLLSALSPPLLGSVWMGVGLWLLQRGLRTLGVAPSGWRLALELLVGVASYALYLRLAHPALWSQASAWLRQRNQPNQDSGHAPGNDPADGPSRESA